MTQAAPPELAPHGQGLHPGGPGRISAVRMLAAREGLFALAFLALALAVTWPAPLSLHRSFLGSAEGDTYLIASVLEWGYQCIPRAFRGFWDAPFFFPLPNVITYSDHDLGILPFYAPARLLSGNPILAYNAAYLLEFALCGYGGFLLARHLTRSVPAAFLAGALFEVLPYKVYNADHQQCIALGFLPLTILALHRLLQDGRAIDGLFVAAAFTMNFLTGFYNGMFLGALIPPILLLLAWGDGVRLRHALRAVGWLAAALLVLLAIHIPMLRNQREHRLRRTVQENAESSARPTDYLMAPAGSFAARVPLPFPDPNRAWPPGKRVSYIGIVPMALAAAAVLSASGAPWWVARYVMLASLAFLLSLGPRLVLTQQVGDTPYIPLPYMLLYRFVPGFDALRTPVRLSPFLAAFLIPVVAQGAARLLPGRARAAWAIVLSLVVLHRLDCWPLAYYPSRPVRDVAADPAYRDLRSAPGRFAILEIPADWRSNGVAMWAAAQHGRPVVNGWSGFLIEGHQRLFGVATSFPSGKAISMLQGFVTADTGVRRVIWRKEAGLEEEFARARRDAGIYPAAPLLADHGDVLVFGLRPWAELFTVRPGAPLPHPLVPVPLDTLTQRSRRSHRDGAGLTMTSPGLASVRLPMQRGLAGCEVTCRATTGGRATPPQRVRVLFEGNELCRAFVPWDEVFTLRTPAVEILTPGHYEVAVSFEPSEVVEGRRPGLRVTLTALSFAAP